MSHEPPLEFKTGRDKPVPYGTRLERTDGLRTKRTGGLGTERTGGFGTERTGGFGTGP